ncbi:MAG: sigma-70 family RNA polymerase sigma factor [Polyangiaceae bacterium]|nr:sigma-70 family RNA polymerase sigma factor [Polyangiaceae bacterium]
MPLRSPSRPPAVVRDLPGPPRGGGRTEASTEEGPSKRELVLRFRAGSREAAGVLYDRHARMVRGVLLRAMGPDQEIEDLVHEVFVQLFSAPGALREPEKVGSFLFGMALRVASGELRRRRVRRRVLLTADGDVPERAAPPPDSAARRAVLALHRILDDLETHDRPATPRRTCGLATVSPGRPRCSSLCSRSRRSPGGAPQRGWGSWWGRARIAWPSPVTPSRRTSDDARPSGPS